MSARLVVGPFKRADGDLLLQLDVADGRVEKAQVVLPPQRAPGRAFTGRSPREALALLPRAATSSSVAQTVAATRALADAAGLVPSPNGACVADLMLATELVAEHLSFFYLFCLPDFVRPAYAGRPWFAEAERRYAPLAGEQARKAIAARQRWTEVLAALGGRWPHAPNLQPGGSAVPIAAAEKPRLLGRLREMRSFLERELFAAPLDEVLALDSLAALERWRSAAPGDGDLRQWLTLALDTGLASLGRGPGRLLALGASPRGLWLRGQVQAVNTDALTEEVTQAWLHERAALAQRLDGKAVETGAMARLAVAGQPLLRDALLRLGGTVHTRVLARVLELGATLQRMEQQLAALQPREPFIAEEPGPAPGEGQGLAEASRGLLGHWLRLEKGRVANWAVVAPWHWHLAPLEAALVGAPVVAGDALPPAVQQVVRSFDL